MQPTIIISPEDMLALSAAVLPVTIPKEGNFVIINRRGRKK